MRLKKRKTVMRVFYANLAGVTLDAYQMMKDFLFNRAKSELKLSDQDVITRPLRPEDLGLSTAEWTFTTSGTGWQTLVSAVTIADCAFIGINGVSYLQSGTQGITQLRITRAGSKTRYWQIQGINLQENPVVYADDPFTVDQNTTITIEGYVLSTGTEKLGLIGMVAEKRGLLINP